MSEINDGGPAFPVLVGVDVCGQPSQVADVSGMTLRDYFAAKAPTLSLITIRDMLGWPKDLKEGNGDEEFDDTIISRWNAVTVADRANAEAEWAFLYADAMIRRRGH